MVPTPLSSEPIPKGMARILGGERVRADYRAQQKKKREEEDRDRKGRDTIELLPGESLREFNRYVRRAWQAPTWGQIRLKRNGNLGALKRKNEEKRREKKETKKRKRDESDDEGEDAKGVEQRPVREFATVSSSAPRRLNEVAQAPPVLTKGPKGSGVGKDGGKAPAVSMARKVILERERARVVELYRALKVSRETGDSDKRAHPDGLPWELQSWAMASSTAGATISGPRRGHDRPIRRGPTRASPVPDISDPIPRATPEEHRAMSGPGSALPPLTRPMGTATLGCRAIASKTETTSRVGRRQGR
ncbi:hypothetical protein AG1IA_01081 [Rhizoctonia solani AG-1 IA]|uniref:Uncharacterized protein n=1 Tax=Thanatephorus cucumeris (strain AG1-IA) TaxID=983506 RepID=L8X3V8_THACA|nr:hypothetical protein AG1IA_01081 [Rhizoctonia solani AG-1 IA]